VTRRPYAEARRLWRLQPIFLDTETTGRGRQDQIIEIAVIEHRGAVLIDTLVQPTVPISPGARRVHRITEDEVADAPTFPEIWPYLIKILRSRPVIIYNWTFDCRLLRQTAEAHGIRFAPPVSVHCAMALYEAFMGKTRLADAAAACGLPIPRPLHRAAADAELTRRLVRYMAGL